MLISLHCCKWGKHIPTEHSLDTGLRNSFLMEQLLHKHRILLSLHICIGHRSCTRCSWQLQQWVLQRPNFHFLYPEKNFCGKIYVKWSMRFATYRHGECWLKCDWNGVSLLVTSAKQSVTGGTCSTAASKRGLTPKLPPRRCFTMSHQLFSEGSI